MVKIIKQYGLVVRLTCVHFFLFLIFCDFFKNLYNFLKNVPRRHKPYNYFFCGTQVTNHKKKNVYSYHHQQKIEQVKEFRAQGII